MICPQCGYDMGNKSKCMRCGYEVTAIVPVAEKEGGESKREEENVTKVIDPDRVFITSGDGYDDGFADPFSMLFGDIFDPISSLLGGLFGVDFSSHGDMYSDRIEESDEKKKKNNQVVEVKKVEIYDENGNPVEQESKLKKTVKKTVNKIKNKVKDAFRDDDKK